MEPNETVLTIDAIRMAMGEEAEEFLAVMEIVQGILNDPSDYTGRRAAIEANRLAALRTKIGIKGQYYKTAEKSIRNTKIKNVLLTMFQALEENINTLKILARMETSMMK